MNIDSLLIKDYETPAEYKRRYLALSKLNPILQLGADEQTQATIEEVCDGDPEDVSSLIAYLQSPYGEEDMLAVYQLGILMLTNPIQLHRYVEAIKAIQEIEELVGGSSEEKGDIQELFEDTLYVLKDKAKRARRLVEDHEGSEENVHAFEAMNCLRTNASALREIRSTQSELLDQKMNALKLRDKTLQDLQRINNNERRTRTR